MKGGAHYQNWAQEAFQWSGIMRENGIELAQIWLSSWVVTGPNRARLLDTSLLWRKFFVSRKIIQVTNVKTL
jgi:hypothetical protein